jgi:hypothetical protein
MNSKNIVIAVLALTLVGAVVFLLINTSNDTTVIVEEAPAVEIDTEVETPEVSDVIDTEIEEIAVTTRGAQTVIGNSVNGTEIDAYHFGTGATEVLIVGGTHGSYSPNTTALAREAVDYFNENPSAVPETVTLTIIPTLNPDGFALTGTEGRFNANNVDLNRNFDCEWSATGMWRDQEVSGGAAAFSEPEAAALRDYVEEYDPNAAIVLFSAEGKVYPSACGGAPSNASVALAATYATAAGYPAEAEFDAYAITGDMVNWMAGEGIPAISVLLSNHQGAEWSKNQAGIEAVLASYAN